MKRKSSRATTPAREAQRLGAEAARTAVDAGRPVAAAADRAAKAAGPAIAAGAARARRTKHPLARGAALSVLAAGGAAWTAAYRADRRRIAADPVKPGLDFELHGRPLAVRAGDGTDLRVRVFGPEGAPTIVLVHGWTCALEFWTLQIQALQDEFRIVAYDLRGHGGSAPSSGGDYSIDAQRDDLEAVLRAAVPADERAVLVGHSLGAMTIVAWAADHGASLTDRVSAVGLFSTGLDDLITSSLILPAPGIGPRVQQELGQLLLGSKLPIPKRATPISSRVVRYVALCGAASPATVAFSEQLVLSCPRDVRANTGSAVSRVELLQGLDAIDVPTTVLVGRDDRLTPPVHAERMTAALSDVLEMIELPDVGHMAPLEAPERTTAAIRALVAAGDRAAAPVGD
ncbi:alpha/beta fold hydrolase [Patulibacter minatonensis]|uniref:alpha/beta fold hydrolase n=1 Tax=Patulibacter minatonensis TaxID=298163 RepID=UPI0004B299AF|nr:alpha/beta hydrolase [Patulibacter minatonensis]